MQRPEPGYKPAVSLFVVRWGGESTLFNVEQWGEASSSVSDSYIDFVIDGTLYSRVGPDYEVVTAYVESGSDMLKLQPSAIAPMLTGRHVCGLYFLWPVMAQDGGDAEQSGMVNQVDYFASVHSFEQRACRHASPRPQVYRTLLAKEWQPALCLNGRLRVPVATVARATVIRSPRRAAACVMEALGSSHPALRGGRRRAGLPASARGRGAEGRRQARLCMGGVARPRLPWRGAARRGT